MAVLVLLNIILLDAIEIKMCKSFSLYRLFTMNSTVCRNISHAVMVLEKMVTTIVIALCSTAFQSFIGYYWTSPNSHNQIKNNNLD